MDKSQILRTLEQTISEAQELGMDTRHMEALLEKLRESLDGLEELMAK